MHHIRYVFGTLAVIAALVVAAGLLVPHMVETAAVRRTVAGWLAARLEREVAIDGPLRLSLLPMIGFVIEDLSVAGPAGLAEGAVLRVKRAEVAVAPLPLLQRQVVVERVHLQSPQVDLVRDAAGRTNWDGLGGNGTGGDLAVGAKTAAVLLEFSEVAVTDGSLRIADAVGGGEALFSAIDFHRRGRGDQRFALRARVDFRRSAIPGLARLGADVRLDGRAVADLQGHRYAIDRANLDLVLNRPGVDGKLATLEAVLSADIFAARLSLENLRINASGARMIGSADGRMENGRPSLAARVNLKIASLETLLAATGLAVPPQSRRHYPSSADLDLDLSATTTSLTLTRVQGQIDRIALEGTLALAAGEPLLCTAKLRTGQIDLNPYAPPPQDGSQEMTLPVIPGLSLNLALDAEALIWRQYRIDQARLEMRATPADGVIIETAAGQFAGGNWRLGGKLNAEARTLSGSMTLAARDVAVTNLWPAGAAPIFARGRVDLDAQLTTRGADPDTLHRQASGWVRLSTRRPLQVADTLQTKFQGRLEANLSPDRRLSLTAELQGAQPDFEAAVNTEGIWHPETLTLESDRASVKIETPILPGPDSKVSLDGALCLSVGQRRASWRRMRLSALGLTAGGMLDAGYADNRPQIDATLDVQPLDLRPWLQTRGIRVPPLGDPGALGRAAARAHLNYDGQRLVIRDLEADLDNTHLRGIVDIAAFDPLRASFMLDADRIDLDRYLPEPGQAEDPLSRRPENPGDLSAVAIAGTLTVAQLRVFDLDASDVFAKIGADRSTLKLDPVSLTLYDGTAKGRMTIALDGADPIWQIEASADDVNLRQPLEVIFGLPVLSGRAEIQANLVDHKTTAPKTVAGLNGQVDITVRDGVIHGVQIVPQVIADSGRPPSEARPAPSDSPPVQPFDTIEGRWILTDGVAVTKDHRLSGPYLNMEASGRVDFVQKRLDATLATDISGIPVVYYALNGRFGDIRVVMDRSRLVMDTTTGIVNSPLKLGQGALGVGADMLERGGQAIGGDSGVQQVGKGVMEVGKGVMEVGKGVLELHQGGESLGQGAKSVGQGVYGMGKGVVGVGKDVLDAGISALEGFGRGLERLFGGRAARQPPATDSPAQKQAD